VMSGNTTTIKPDSVYVKGSLTMTCNQDINIGSLIVDGPEETLSKDTSTLQITPTTSVLIEPPTIPVFKTHTLKKSNKLSYC